MTGDPPKKDLIPVEQNGDENMEEGLSGEDLDALNDFCSSFELEDISFDAFCEVNASLDVCLHLRLTAKECEDGGSRQIEYTRTVKVSTPSGVRVTREKVIVEVTWNEGACHGDVICVDDQGDKDHTDQTGNLVVTIKAS
jgi:DnaJ-class molecular chaperone